MRRKKKASLSWEQLLPLGLLAAVFAFAFFSSVSPLHTETVQAQTSSSNYAWSETIGWISFDCANAGVCGASNYKVSQAAGGALSGYAWSENIGWISFNAADVAGCPSGTCAPSVNLTSGAVSGWARACGSFDSTNACSGAQTRAGGWQGWIHLSGSGYGTTQSLSDCRWTGWAWGGGNTAEDAIIGWIHFNGSGYQVSVTDAGSGCDTNPPNVPEVTLTATPAPGFADPTVPSNVAYTTTASNNVTLTLTTQHIANCTAITGGNPSQTINLLGTDYNRTVTKLGTSRNSNPINGDGSINIYPTTYSITCTPDDNTADITDTANITVAGRPATTSGGCVINSFRPALNRVNKDRSTTLSWQTNSCSSCSITATPAAAVSTFPYSVPSTDVVSGSKSTDLLRVRTTYRLICDGVSAQTSVDVDTETVEL